MNSYLATKRHGVTKKYVGKQIKNIPKIKDNVLRSDSSSGARYTFRHRSEARW